ncbi:unnamed protein product, partial [Mesorhabditis spiculigera]
MDAMPSMDDLLDEAEDEIRSPNTTYHSAFSSFSPFQKADESLSPTYSGNRTPEEGDPEFEGIEKERPESGTPRTIRARTFQQSEQIKEMVIELLERTQDVEEELVIETPGARDLVESPSPGPSLSPEPEDSEENINPEVETPRKKNLLFTTASKNDAPNEEDEFEEALRYLGIEEKDEGAEEVDPSQPLAAASSQKEAFGDYADVPAVQVAAPEIIISRAEDDEECSLVLESSEKEYISTWARGFVENLIDTSINNFTKLGNCQKSPEVRAIEELVDEMVSLALTEVTGKRNSIEEPATPNRGSRKRSEDPGDSAPPEKVEKSTDDIKETILAMEAGHGVVQAKERDEAVAEGSENQEEEQEEEEEAHAEQAIEVAEAPSSPAHSAEAMPTVRGRFEDQVIAVVHDLDQESDRMLLTESELLLGKVKPFWIPDADCMVCMLCSAKFTLLVRRHHCRACGRVLCAACCNEKASLAYLGDDEKKNKQRVCQPCLSMLDRIKAYEDRQELVEFEENPSTTRTRSVLKSRPIDVEGVEEGDGIGPSTSSLPNSYPEGMSVERKRSVVFRDGSRPGEHSGDATEQTVLKAKKKSGRKRVHVTQKLASIKIEEEMASYLPAEWSGPFIVRNADGTVARQTNDELIERLKQKSSVEVFLKRNLQCVVQFADHPTKPDTEICGVSSKGFFAIGVDEIVYIWELNEEPIDYSVPLGVLARFAEVDLSCLEDGGSGIRPMTGRLPALHSCSDPTQSSQCATHILFYRPSRKEAKTISITWPQSPYVIGISIHPDELVWALAHPNRLLLRMGLDQSWYPYPVINSVGLLPVFGKNTNNTVIKMFTDFREWAFRMEQISGSTVVLKGTETSIRIPRAAREQIKTLVQGNARMMAWQCGLASEADSQLVCVDDGGLLTTQLLARGHTRAVTGASFVIFDSGLKSADDVFQITIVEDGVTIRMSGDSLEKLADALKVGEDWEAISPKGAGVVRVQWVDAEYFLNDDSVSNLVSPIDGRYMGGHFQYGLSLTRALSTSIQVCASPEYAVRLSHVFHVGDDRIAPDDEAKVFSVAEMLAREATKHLDSFVQPLTSIGQMSVAIRLEVCDQDVSMDIAPWEGLEQQRDQYVSSMDQLVPILYGLLEYIPGGLNLEIHLAIVSARDPFEN